MFHRLRGRLGQYRLLQRIERGVRPITGRLGWRLGRLLDRRSMDEASFVEHLKRSGFTPGATVMLHCSMDEVVRRVPGMNAVTLVKCLQELLGDTGTLLMPTSPFRGSQYAYLQTTKTFDVRRTPSQLGLVTEVFRRTPGVIRSKHPTHSVAAWGRHAETLVSQHHLGTAFGETSPFARLQDHDGIVVGLGVGLRRAFTILHAVEESHAPTRDAIFSKETFVVTVTDGSDTFDYTMLPLSGRAVPRRVAALEEALLRGGALRYHLAHGLLFAAAEAKSFIQLGYEFIDTNRYV